MTAEEGEEEDAGPDESQVVGPDGVFRLNRESFGGSTLWKIHRMEIQSQISLSISYQNFNG